MRIDTYTHVFNLHKNLFFILKSADIMLIFKFFFRNKIIFKQLILIKCRIHAGYIMLAIFHHTAYLFLIRQWYIGCQLNISVPFLPQSDITEVITLRLHQHFRFPVYTEITQPPGIIYHIDDIIYIHNKSVFLNIFLSYLFNQFVKIQNVFRIGKFFSIFQADNIRLSIMMNIGI